LRPQLGRFFGRDEDYPTPADVSVISHNLWQSRFSGDSNVLGGVLNVNGYPTRIIGVTPDGFNGPVVGVRLDVYVPLGLQAPALPESSSLSRWNSAQVEAIGRLSRDQSPVTARSELTRLATDFVSAFDNEGDSRAAHAVHVETWSPVPPTIRAGVALFFSVLMATVGVLLGMACLNVTNMLLSMSVERRREFSIRLAMGASRRRLVRQLLTEGAVLFAVAGVAGAVLAAWASRVLLSFQPPLPPGFVVDLNVGIDWRVLVYCAVIAAVSCVAFSLAPAFRATRLDIVSALRNDSGGAGGTRFRSVMITVQMAGTLVLLVGAGLFARALHAMESLDPGWNADRVYVAELDMNLVGMPQDRGAIFFRELLERVRAIPGVEAASLAAKLPLAGSSSLGGVNVQGVDPPNSFGFNASLNRVSDEYFRSVDLQIIQGRDFAADIDGANRVAVINEAMAARLWPAGEAVGESFLLGDVASGVSFEVIGVVENAKYRRLVEETPNFYYLSHQQFYNDQMVLHMKIAEGSVATTAAQLRTVTRELAPNLATPDFRELDGVLGVFLLPQRIGAFVAGVMGVIGLLLGVVGVYGVTSFLMGQRRREIGVRIALGGQQGRVVRGLMARGLIAPAAGIGIGLVLAMGFARLAGSFLGVVSPVDPLTFGSVVLVLSLAAALATFLPTARAVGAAPVAVLKDR
jgi:predicted permease